MFNFFKPIKEFCNNNPPTEAGIVTTMIAFMLGTIPLNICGDKIENWSLSTQVFFLGAPVVLGLVATAISYTLQDPPPPALPCCYS